MTTATFSALDHSRLQTATSTTAIWSGRFLSALAVLFLTFDTVIKVLRLPVALAATAQLGFTDNAAFAIGVIEAACLVLYLVPRTSALGAVLWTGYLGGAIATHIRAASPLVTHALFPIYVAALLWIGLWLRNDRIRRIVRAAFEATA
jgi:hypothetical protein